MKTKLLLAAILVFNIVQSQTILIPNGGFNTDTSGWSISGTDTSISNPGGFLSIDVSGAYTRDFVLTSPEFNLEANKTYKLYSAYRNVQLDPNDPMMMETLLGGFSDVFLKDSSGTTVANIGLGASCTGGYYDTCNSSDFNVAASGTYHLEYTGQQNPNDTEYYLDNVGFEEVIKNTFSGTVTLDVNNDGCTTGTVVENFPIQLNETTTNTNYHVFTDVNGDFIIETQNITGNFITQTNLAVYNSTPINYTNTISSGVNNITNQNFCVTPNTTANDIIVSLIPTTQARPGFNTSYQIRYTNLGTTTLNGTVDLSFDNTKVTYLTASIVPNATTANLLSWNYTNLIPLETRYIDVNFNIFTPPTVNNGDVLSYTTSATPTSGDATPANNTFTFDQITIGSYDPNDITIIEGPLISQSQANEYLNIIIRFQNTGTASAINITVKNTLDAFLDWSTFQPIAASHNYNTIISNNNEVEFAFNGIHLSDSTTDEPNSHGWVFYKIKAKNTFVIGNVISKTASIYFDYNLPIITNTATTQIPAALEVKDYAITNLNVYPNPAKNKVTIKTDRLSGYKIFNINGQLIKKGNLVEGENQLNTSTLTNGIYYINIFSDTHRISKKLIIQK